MSESVVLKGTKEGLMIVLNGANDFQELKEQLREKLEANARFFNGAGLILAAGNRDFTRDQVEELKTLIGNTCGGKLVKVVPAGEPGSGREDQPSKKALILKRTVHCGQEVLYDGDVVIVGDVNPGAEVVASGDILVMGSLRGMAHAGALGDQNAIIAALRLEPLQLRIGPFISRSPDGDRASSGRPEVAMVKDGVIVIEDLLEVYRNG
ncbi:MAG: septum site-determining protein MinC [Bacillota bacterium]